MNRRFGRRPQAHRTYLPRPGVYAVIRAQGGVLVTFQESPRPEFQLPGGGVDPHESSLPALHREVFEETGFRIRVVRRLGMFHRHTYMPEYRLWAHKQCHIYLADAALRIGPPTEPGHWPAILSWDEAATRLAISGDRNFLRAAARWKP